MEQEAIIDVGEFDHSAVDLNKPASTVTEYIKQVIVSREQCPDVAVASNIDRSKFKKPTCLVPVDDSISAICEFTPPVEWSELKVRNFSVMRTAFEEKRDLNVQTELFKFPNFTDPVGWVSFCLFNRCKSLKMSQTLAEAFSHHQGTPPTLSLVMSIPDNTVNFVLLHLTKHFVENGYSRALAEWIFSLLLAVKKPLIHDVCNSLRQLTRFCRIERAKLTNLDLPMIREYTVFIAIITLYFGQRDLRDR